MTVYFYHFAAYRKVWDGNQERLRHCDGIVIMDRPAVMEGYKHLRDIVARVMFGGDREFILQSLQLVHRQGPAQDVDCTNILQRYPHRVITEWPHGPGATKRKDNAADKGAFAGWFSGQLRQQAPGQDRHSSIAELLAKILVQSVGLIVLFFVLLLIIGQTCAALS